MDIIIIQILKKKKSDSCNSIFRFYDKNNRVISVVCGQNEKRTNYFGDFFPSGNWFDENYEDNGCYEISGEQISFKCGNVLYNGTIVSQDKLKLFYHSNINGHEGTMEYKFISFELLNDIKALEN